MPDSKAVKARVEGRVQDVSFRAWTQIEAKVRGLTGWVRREPDGAVTALLSGPAPAVDEMLRQMRHGPPAAVVRGLTVHPADRPEGSGFDILR